MATPWARLVADVAFVSSGEDEHGKKLLPHGICNCQEEGIKSKKAQRHFALFFTISGANGVANESELVFNYSCKIIYSV